MQTRVLASCAASGYAHAAETREMRSLRALRLEALSLLATCARRFVVVGGGGGSGGTGGSGDGGGVSDAETRGAAFILGLCSPLLSQLLPRVAAEAPVARVPSLPQLLCTLTPALSAEQSVGSLAMLLPLTLEAAQAESPTAHPPSPLRGSSSRAGAPPPPAAASVSAASAACASAALTSSFDAPLPSHGSVLLEWIEAVATSGALASGGCATPELCGAVAASLRWALSVPPLAPHALLLTHRLARAGGVLEADQLGALLGPMRRALTALASLAEVRALCTEAGLDVGTVASRAGLHARLLGLSDEAFARLGEEDSEEAVDELECFWMQATEQD